jgi:hypothetical protein
MASHKNQHFVPRCYLKAFSFRGEGRAIHLYNIDRCSGVPNAPLKGQCAATYFYGEDLRLEKLLQKSEEVYAKTLHSVISDGYILTEGDKTVLRHFCYLQHCRSESTLRQAARSMSEISEVTWGESVPEDWRITMRDAVLAGMRAFSDTMSVVHDLKVCLIRNETRRRFVTSDDPAVMTNRWYEQNPKARGMNGGSGSSGVLFFLPLGDIPFDKPTREL